MTHTNQRVYQLRSDMADLINLSADRNFEQMKNYLNGQLEAQKEILRTMVPVTTDDKNNNDLENRVESIENGLTSTNDSLSEIKKQISDVKLETMNDQVKGAHFWTFQALVQLKNFKVKQELKNSSSI